MIILVAVDSNWGIAKYNKIPWLNTNIGKEDLVRFKELTVGHNVVMGYNTWLSLPIKPLPLRYNYVLSKTHYESPINVDGPYFRQDISYIDLGKNTFIIGGRQIYKEFLKRNLVDKCIITQLYEDYRCNLMFPLELLDHNMLLTNVSVESEFKTLIYERNK